MSRELRAQVKHIKKEGRRAIQTEKAASSRPESPQGLKLVRAVFENGEIQGRGQATYRNFIWKSLEKAVKA